MSGKLRAERIGTLGRVIEVASIEIDRYGDALSFFIRGRKQNKHYYMNVGHLRAALNTMDTEYRERGGEQEKL